MWICARFALMTVSSSEKMQKMMKQHSQRSVTLETEDSSADGLRVFDIMRGDVINWWRI